MATIVPVAPDTGGTMDAGGVPDADLVDGLRAGRRDAFEQLYELYRARIYNLAVRILQSPEDARDITQDVFIKVYRRLPGSRLSDLQLKPWLYRVAVNACYDHLRTRRIHRDIDIVSDTRAVPVDTFEQSEMTHLVERTLGDLSERHRTVLVLKDIHGLRHDEIAGILDISRGATETLLFRARESFRSHYLELTSELPAPSCTFARDAAVSAVGGELSGDERQRILAHADHCPDCRETVRTWGAAAIGLGLFLHGVPVPASLQGAFPFGAAGAATGGVGASAATGAGATGAGTGAAGTGTGAGMSAGSAAAGSAGVAAGGAGVTASSATGFSLVTGGLLTKVGGAATLKIAALVVAATCTAGGGVAAYEADVLPGVHHHPTTPAATRAHGGAAATKHGEGTWTPPGLATATANGGKGAERSAAAHARDKGKGKSAAAKDRAPGKKKGAAKGKSGAQHGNAGGNGNGNAGANSNAGGNGNAGANSNAGGNSNPGGSSKPTKATKPAKPAKPASRTSPTSPTSPARTSRPPPETPRAPAPARCPL